jgi:hypothetical protein
MKLTFYYDVCSQWSYFGDLALDRLRTKHGSDLDVEGNDRTLYANLAVAAAGRLGHDVRRQVAEAILLRGEPMGSQTGAVGAVSRLIAVPPDRLEAAMEAVEPGVRKSTQEFRALPVTVVLTFLIRNEIDDTACSPACASPKRSTR